MPITKTTLDQLNTYITDADGALTKGETDVMTQINNLKSGGGNHPKRPCSAAVEYLAIYHHGICIRKRDEGICRLAQARCKSTQLMLNSTY